MIDWIDAEDMSFLPSRRTGVRRQRGCPTIFNCGILPRPHGMKAILPDECRYSHGGSSSMSQEAFSCCGAVNLGGNTCSNNFERCGLHTFFVTLPVLWRKAARKSSTFCCSEGGKPAFRVLCNQIGTVLHGFENYRMAAGGAGVKCTRQDQG